MTLHLVTPEYPPSIGGVAAHSRQLARGLRGAGLDVHIWCPDGDDEPGCTVHRTLGAFGPDDLDATGTSLDRCQGPRRLLVQWVPHGYGRRSMNLQFCRWVGQRARAGDRVEIVVHEPFLSWTEGTVRQTAAAAVHRLMTVALLRAASLVWMSTPAWEPMWRPYTLGRNVPFRWLPIPTPLPAPGRDEVRLLRRMYSGTPLIGHFGTYGPHVSPLLRTVIDRLKHTVPNGRVLLMGAGSGEFHSRYVEVTGHAPLDIRATGRLDGEALANHLAACDLVIQPYADGLSFRRTTAMAALALGVPMISTEGYVTEPLWRDSRVVPLVGVQQVGDMADEAAALLRDAAAREAIGRAGRDLYERMFDVRHAVAALTLDGAGKAA